MFKQALITTATAALLLTAQMVSAENYVIDTKGSHASINFKIPHLGYSFVTGRFNKFSGTFNYDEKNPSASKVSVEIDTSSVDSNHAERDKHLRSGDFFEVSKYSKASFVSSSYEDKGNGKGMIKGDLTLHGVTKSVVIDVMQVGAGKDPWGGFRRGFVGTTKIALKDYGINFNLGPASKEVEISLNVEGIRK